MGGLAKEMTMAEELRDIKRSMLVLGMVGHYRPTQEGLSDIEEGLGFDIEPFITYLMEIGRIWKVDGHYLPGIEGALWLSSRFPEFFDARGLPR